MFKKYFQCIIRIVLVEFFLVSNVSFAFEDVRTFSDSSALRVPSYRQGIDIGQGDRVISEIVGDRAKGGDVGNKGIVFRRKDVQIPSPQPVLGIADEDVGRYLDKYLQLKEELLKAVSEGTLEQELAGINTELAKLLSERRTQLRTRLTDKEQELTALTQTDPTLTSGVKAGVKTDPDFTKAEWKRLTDDEEAKKLLGNKVGWQATDPDTGITYLPTWCKGTVVMVVKMSADGKLEEFIPNITGRPTKACAIMKDYDKGGDRLLVATSRGVYVYKMDGSLDTRIGNNGIIAEGRNCIGVAALMFNGKWSVFVNDWGNDELLKYNEANNFTGPDERLPIYEPHGLTPTFDNRLLLAYYGNLCILNPETMEPEYDSGEMGDLLDGACQVVEIGEYLIVTGFNSGKSLIFKKTDDKIEIEYGRDDNKVTKKVKELKRISANNGILSDSGAKRPVGISLDKDGNLLISSWGKDNTPPSLWRVTIPGLSTVRLKERADCLKQEITALEQELAGINTELAKFSNYLTEKPISERGMSIDKIKQVISSSL